VARFGSLILGECCVIISLTLFFGALWAGLRDGSHLILWASWGGLYVDCEWVFCVFGWCGGVDNLLRFVTVVPRVLAAIN